MNDIAEKKEQEISTDVVDLSQYQGLGVEDATVDDISIPFLVVLQKNSPQVDPDHAKFVLDATPGMIMNTVTGDLYPGRDAGLKMYHVMFMKNLVEWVPRNEGGGMVGIHDMNSDILREAKEHPEKRFLKVTAAGTELVDTRYHYVLFEGKDGLEPAVLTMTSTMVKVSRKWISRLKTTRVKLPDGRVIDGPAWTYPYQATVVSDSNKKGSWLTWSFEKLESESCVTDKAVFDTCASFYKAIKKGETKLSDMEETMSHGDTRGDEGGDEIPF